MQRLRWVTRRTPQSQASRAEAVRGDSFHRTSSLSGKPNSDAANGAGASKPAIPPKRATRHGRAPVAPGLTPLSHTKNKNSSCNLLLLNSHQEEIVFCHITLNKLCKGWGQFLPSKLLHSCAASFSKGPSNGTISFFELFFSFFLLERPLINESGQRGWQKERALERWDRSVASHTHTSGWSYWFI